MWSVLQVHFSVKNDDRAIQLYQADVGVREVRLSKIQAIGKFVAKSGIWTSARQAVKSRGQ